LLGERHRNLWRVQKSLDDVILLGFSRTRIDKDARTGYFPAGVRSPTKISDDLSWIEKRPVDKYQGMALNTEVENTGIGIGRC
tara:strand:- start:1078 stop:1326 length:249 start_codon:yes stop_codon:yes gene_type:complete